MGLFNVPQFIDIEDKIVGPLTAKQLGWLGAAGVIILVLYSVLDQAAFFFAAIIVLLIFGALAFYRPHGQPLIFFILSAFSFFTRPTLYIWKRVPGKQASLKKPTPKKVTSLPKKDFSKQKIEDISKLLNQNH